MRRTTAALGSAVFLVIAPGLTAGLVPYWLTGWHGHGSLLGLAILVPAAVVLLDAFARFALQGRGTPAPVAPTEELVVTGLYRHVRNPMYLAVAGVIAGQAILLGRPVLLAWAAVFLAVVATFVRVYEEPALRHRHGEAYAAYCRAVPGWIPRLRAARFE